VKGSVAVDRVPAKAFEAQRTRTWEVCTGWLAESSKDSSWRRRSMQKREGVGAAHETSRRPKMFSRTVGDERMQEQGVSMADPSSMNFALGLLLIVFLPFQHNPCTPFGACTL
jgi:hypothetical protein